MSCDGSCTLLPGDDIHPFVAELDEKCSLKEDAEEKPVISHEIVPPAAQSEVSNEEDLKEARREYMMEVRQKLAERNLSDRGSDFVLKSRLAIYEKRLSESKRVDVQPPLDFLIVVDFEATCEKEKSPGTYDQEIIEFPAVLIDINKKIIVDEFHSYVRPKKNKQLSEFCTFLTGITQNVVDSAEEYPQVISHFWAWLKKHGLLENNKWCVVTDGTFDAALFLHCTCKLNSVVFPSFFKLFIHLPKFFQWAYLSSDVTKQRANMRGMLENLELELEGRLHSGIDDAKNLSKICLKMLIDEIQFRPTDFVDVTLSDERRPFCARVTFIPKNKWRPLHKRVMRNLANR